MHRANNAQKLTLGDFHCFQGSPCSLAAFGPCRALVEVFHVSNVPVLAATDSLVTLTPVRK